MATSAGVEGHVATFEAKVCVIGASGVGKTSIANRFVKNQFAPYVHSTIGASFLVKELAVGNRVVTLQIWDTAGQVRTPGGRCRETAASHRVCTLPRPGAF